jgi:hypothetical protein
MNSGPKSLAVDVNVESMVEMLSVRKMMLMMLKMAVPRYLETAAGAPPSMPAKRASETLRETGRKQVHQEANKW